MNSASVASSGSYFHAYIAPACVDVHRDENPDDVKDNQTVYDYNGSTFTLTPILPDSSSKNQKSEVSDLRIVPNPTADFVTIQSSKQIDFVQVYNLLGKLITQQTVTIDNQLSVIDLTSGIYLLTVVFKDQTSASTKLVVQH
jgi:hypothetical protein